MTVPRAGRSAGELAALAGVTALAVLPALVAVVAFSPGSVGWPGARLTVGRSPWYFLLALAAVLFAVILTRARRSAARVGLVVVASAALVAQGVVTARLVSATFAQNVWVNPLVSVDERAPSDAPDLTATYSTFGGEPLDVAVWRPTGGPGTSPVMLYVHGGGWTGGNPLGRAPQMRWFADRGWLVVAPEYPLSGPDEHLWAQTVPEIGCAMVWAAAHAQYFGGDLGQLVLVGDSAGGNLAINAAYLAATGGLRSSCGGSPPRVSAVVGLYPVLDPVGFHDAAGVRGAQARQITEDYIGGPPSEFPNRYRAVDSSAYVSAQAPPTLILVPGSDQLVPPEGARSFARTAAAAGVRVDVVELPYLDHGFDAAPLPDVIFREVSDRWLRSSVP